MGGGSTDSTATESESPTFSPVELLEEAGYGDFFDVSEASTKSEGWYVATGTRRLRYKGRDTVSVIETADQYETHDFEGSLEQHPEGYRGHELPEPADLTLEESNLVLDSHGEAKATHEFETVACEDESFAICETCEWSGQVVCPVCDGNGRRPCINCNGTGTATEYEYCEACNGDGEVQELSEEKCRKCRGSGEVDDLTCPNCGGVGTEKRVKDETCKVCKGSGKTSYKVTCTTCDEHNETDCYNCDEDNLVTCDDCDGDGEVWDYQRVTDYYQVEIDISIDPPPSQFARNLIAADEIEWEHVTDETGREDPPPDDGGIVRAQRGTWRTPRQTVVYSPIRAKSIYDGSTYVPWDGGTQFEQVGSHITKVSGEFGERTRPGIRDFLNSVVSNISRGFLLAIILALGLIQTQPKYGIARIAAGWAVSIAVLASGLLPSLGFALGIIWILFFGAAIPLSDVPTVEAVTITLIGAIPIVIGTAMIGYRYQKYHR